jgi:hypothetical protein
MGTYRSSGLYVYLTGFCAKGPTPLGTRGVGPFSIFTRPTATWRTPLQVNTANNRGSASNKYIFSYLPRLAIDVSRLN